MTDSAEVIVRGTDDVEVAREYALELLAEELYEDAAEVVEGLRPRIGWYRWNPCHESSCFDGGGHAGHLGYADGPGRGRWRGVYLQE